MSFVTPQAPGAAENEALALGLAQRIDVKNGRPMRLRGLVVGESSLAPDAAQMLSVAPEIVNIALNETRIRDAVLRSADDQRLLVQGRIARVGLESRDAIRIMRFHPFQRLGAKTH